MSPPALLSVRLFTKQCHDHGASDSSTERFLPRQERHSWPRSLKCFAFAQLCLSTGFRNRDVRPGDVSRAFPLFSLRAASQPGESRCSCSCFPKKFWRWLSVWINASVELRMFCLVNAITRPPPARLPAFHLSPDF